MGIRQQSTSKASSGMESPFIFQNRGTDRGTDRSAGISEATQSSPFDFGSRTLVPGQGQGQGQAGSGKDAAGSDGSAQLIGTIIVAPGEEDIGPDYGRRHMLHKDRNEVSIYNDQMRERYAMDSRLRTVIILLVSVIILIPLTLVLPSHLGDRGILTDIARIGSSFTGRVQAASEIASGTAAGRAMAMALWQIIAVAVAGAGLAMNGAVYQGVLKNALASPSTLGVMSGATLGSVFYTLFILLPSQEQAEEVILTVDEIVAGYDALNPFDYLIATQSRVLCSLAGSAVVVVLVLLIAYIAGRGRVSKVSLLISGQVFTAIIASIIEMVRYYIREHGTQAQMSALRNVVGGSFDSMMGPYQVLLMSVPIIMGVVAILALRNRLNLLAFDDDEAKSMGIRVTATRNAVVVICTVLTAVIVSFCGTVGFVGFLVPHLARKMVGPDFRYYIPASILLGAAYLTLAFYVMNALYLFGGSVGTFTSIIGALFFIVIAVRQRARGNVDWI